MTFSAAWAEDVFYNREAMMLRTGRIWGAYVETTALAGFKTTLKAATIGGQDNYRLRQFHAPNHASVATGTEERAQRNPLVVSLTFARQF